MQAHDDLVLLPDRRRQQGQVDGEHEGEPLAVALVVAERRGVHEDLLRPRRGPGACAPARRGRQPCRRRGRRCGGSRPRARRRRTGTPNGTARSPGGSATAGAPLRDIRSTRPTCPVSRPTTVSRSCSMRLSRVPCGLEVVGAGRAPHPRRHVLVAHPDVRSAHHPQVGPGVVRRHGPGERGEPRAGDRGRAHSEPPPCHGTVDGAGAVAEVGAEVALEDHRAVARQASRDAVEGHLQRLADALPQGDDGRRPPARRQSRPTDCTPSRRNGGRGVGAGRSGSPGRSVRGRRCPGAR